MIKDCGNWKTGFIDVALLQEVISEIQKHKPTFLRQNPKFPFYPVTNCPVYVVTYEIFYMEGSYVTIKIKYDERENPITANLSISERDLSVLTEKEIWKCKSKLSHKKPSYLWYPMKKGFAPTCQVCLNPMTRVAEPLIPGFRKMLEAINSRVQAEEPVNLLGQAGILQV